MTAEEILKARGEIISHFDYDKFSEVVDFFFLDVDDTRECLRICVLEPSEYTRLLKKQGFVEDIDNRYEKVFQLNFIKRKATDYHERHEEFRRRPLEDSIAELYGQEVADIVILHLYRRNDKEYSLSNQYDIAIGRQHEEQVIKMLKSQGFKVCPAKHSITDFDSYFVSLV